MYGESSKSVPNDIRACGSELGDFEVRTCKVTCQECQKVSGFMASRIRDLGSEKMHLDDGHGLPMCGIDVSHTVDWVSDRPAEVECLDCLRGTSAPSVEGPPIRRILLDADC